MDETTSIRVGQTYVNALLALDTLAEFRHSLGVVAATDIGIHVDGHAGVGGDVRAFPCTIVPSYLLILCQMVNVATSPNDPLFWMHHGFVDYVRLVRFFSCFFLWTDVRVAYLLQLWWKWQGDNETRINDLNNLGYESQKEPATGYVVRATV